MGEANRNRQKITMGLSARLLVLTVVFVMLAEVTIYAPSISRFRKVFLEEQIARARIALLALEAGEGGRVGPELEMELLLHAGAYGIALTRPKKKMLLLGGRMPPKVDLTVDLRRMVFPAWLVDAFITLAQSENRIMRVIAEGPEGSGSTIEVILDETPMRQAMIAFSGRILTLSILISLFTAGLVFFSLQWLMVRPILQITDNIMRFRAGPEDDAPVMPPTRRTDEIGLVQRELATMQQELRAALRQKARLATLGAAMAKINHDLRNTLATAMLASDGLADIDDPEVKRLTPRLYSAIDRAVSLCSQTLNFVQDAKTALRPTQFRLGELVAEVESRLKHDHAATNGLHQIVGDGLDQDVVADRDHLLRVLNNLALNAAQAGAGTLRIDARRQQGRLLIDVADDGPGLAQKARDRLFQPFAGSARKGGTGLGLVIARDIVHAHGGDLTLVRSGEDGTTFRIDLPVRPPAPTTETVP